MAKSEQLQLELSLSPRQVAALLPGYIAAGVNVMLWGPPGICKSALVQQAAETMQRRLVDVRAVLLDPIDLRGLPSFSGEGVNRRTIWAPPDFMPLEPDSTAIVFLDELPQAPMLTQNACLGLVWDRRIGAAVLGQGVAFVAAGNRVGDRAGAGKVTTALSNRFPVHIDVEPSADDWLAWAIHNGVRPDVRMYIAHQPQDLMRFNPAENPRSFPSPRSWEGLSRIMNATPGGVLNESALAVIAGCIGQATAVKFTAFAKIYDQLPAAKDVIADALGATVPEDPMVMYALVGSLVEHARADKKRNDWQALADYVLRFTKPFQVLAIRDICQVVGDTFLDIKAVAKWSSDNVDMLAGPAGGAS